MNLPKKINLNDRVYGNFKITSPVILELLKSPSLQRLKKIAQFGVPDKYYHLKGYSRYEHSVGVMLLLNQLGASDEEQISGLLHDISHTAFSHLVDWVLDQGHREIFQDDNHEKYFYKTEIPKILIKYDFQPQKILDYHRFSLLEQPIPHLCADRIDYAIREFPPNTAQRCFNNFRVFAGKIVFKDKKTAYLFGHHYLKRQLEHWAGFEAAARYGLFADVLKQALKYKIIKFDDLWTWDSLVVKKLEASADKKIKKILTALRKKSLAKLLRQKRKVFKKFRYVDPDIIINNKLIPLSRLDNKFTKEITEAKKITLNGVNLPKI